jgi:HEAT repeat protein
MTFQSLLDLFPDPEQQPSAAQLSSLSHLDAEDIGLLAEAWEDTDATRKRRVILQLSEMAEDNVDLNFDTVFKLGLKDEDASVRAEALRGLIEYEGRDLIITLAELVREDPEPDVRREAAIALGRYALEAELDHLPAGDRDVIYNVLIESVEDTEEDESVRAKSIEALGALSGEETDNLIESVFQEDSIVMKIAAVDAMGRSCSDLWLETVLRELQHRAPLMRHAAAYAAGEIGEEEAVSPLQRVAIQDPDTEVRHAAIRALGAIGGAKAGVALKTVLYEGHDEDRPAIEEAQQELTFYDDPLRPI